MHAWVYFQGNISYLSANMLAFTIAVGPDKENIGTSSLGFDVTGDGFFVLQNLAQYTLSIRKVHTHISNVRLDGSLEQVRRLTR